MAQRTYLIGLYLVVKALQRYTAKWRVQIEENADPAQWACILALINAVNECLPLILPPPPVE